MGSPVKIARGGWVGHPSLAYNLDILQVIGMHIDNFQSSEVIPPMDVLGVPLASRMV